MNANATLQPRRSVPVAVNGGPGGQHQRSNSFGEPGAFAKLGRNSVGSVSHPEGISTPAQGPRFSTPSPVSSSSSPNSRPEWFSESTMTTTQTTRMSSTINNKRETSEAHRSSHAQHDASKRSTESTLPPVKLRLANGQGRPNAYKDMLSLATFGIKDSNDGSGSGGGGDISDASEFLPAEKKSTQRQRWKESWGPGASSVPPDPSTQPKVEGFDAERTMAPAAFNGFVTAAACSWGGREKNKWKKENQDTFIISPNCQAVGAQSDGGATSRGGAGGPGYGRRSKRHSTGSTSPIPGVVVSGARTGVGVGGVSGGTAGPPRQGDSSACLLGVLDGHGINGRYVSTFVRDHLLKDISEEVFINANQGVDLFAGTSMASKRAAESTVTAACRRADQALRTAPCDKDVQLSGSTCALAVLTPHTLLTACVGDSRVVLGRRVSADVSSAGGGSGGGGRTSKSYSSGLEAVALTRDHKPEDPIECTRILAANGRVAKMKLGSGLEVGPPRVFLKFSWTPGLAVSRAFGDLLAHEVGVISEPDVATRELEDGDTLLVLASDGVWEHLTNQEVIDIAAEAGGYRAGTPSSLPSSFDNAAAARAVCAAARVAWTRESAASVDDITAVVAHISHGARENVPPRLANMTRGRAARMSIGAMMNFT